MKVDLLEAELFSFEGNHLMARESYAAAIQGAKSSRFIHEEGLACELAGCHSNKLGDVPRALDFFTRAKQCYSKWGSQMKVESVSRQIESMQTKLKGS